MEQLPMVSKSMSLPSAGSCLKGNLSASPGATTQRGLIVIDPDKDVTAIDRMAIDHLRLPTRPFIGRSLAELLSLSPVISEQAAMRLARLRPTVTTIIEKIAGQGERQGLELHLQPLEGGYTAIGIQPDGAGDMPMGDRLTGLLDRDGFLKLLKSAIRSRKPGGCIAVISTDIQRFKWVNDLYGHDQADAVMRQMASRITGSLQPGDFATRLRGSEFAIAIQCGDGPNTVMEVGRQLYGVLSEACLLDNHPMMVKPLIGIAMSPEQGDDPASLLRGASLAMRQAGQDNSPIRVFQQSMLAEANHRRTLEIDLRMAIEREEFELYYQPQFVTGTGALGGFEALVRWNHPDRGMVPPLEFIPLAEELGLITDLGRWVLKEACRQAAQWPGDLYVSVNVSGLQFDDGQLASSVRDALATSGLAGSRLEIEITETAVLRSCDSVLETLKALRELGARISMDDFGTGYSSLTQLRKFPFDKLKIDRSFVSGIGTDPDAPAIVRAITRMGASLGLTIVAEGVETLEQWDMLKAEGCDEAQGYLLGRPTQYSKLGLFLGQSSASQGPAIH